MTIQRRRAGSGHAYYVDGEKVPGVTTILKVLPLNLADWAARCAADYALDHWDELCDAKPSERHDLLRYARLKVKDAAARRGTEVHALADALTQPLAEGEEPPRVPPELVGHVEAYGRWLDQIQPAVLANELVVASRTFRFCGTADLVADLPELLCDFQVIPPARWLLELKTTASGVWPESALQATAYRHAEMYVHPEHPDVEQPMDLLGIERAGVVWIKSDSCELHPVDTSPELWEFFRHCRWMFDRMEYDRGNVKLPGHWLSPVATTGELVANY